MGRLADVNYFFRPKVLIVANQVEVVLVVHLVLSVPRLGGADGDLAQAHDWGTGCSWPQGTPGDTPIKWGTVSGPA